MTWYNVENPLGKRREISRHYPYNGVWIIEQETFSIGETKSLFHKKIIVFHSEIHQLKKKGDNTCQNFETVSKSGFTTVIAIEGHMTTV